MVSVSQVRTVCAPDKDEEDRKVSTDTAEATGIPFDPFELKDTVSGTLRNPFPRMQELRRECPVHSGPIDLGEGLDGPSTRTGRRR